MIEKKRPKRNPITDKIAIFAAILSITMTNDDEKCFGIFEEKLSQLIDSHTQLKTKNLELELELSSVRAQLQQTVQEYEELQSSYQNLKAGRVLEGLDVTDVTVTRERLAKLVRDVDRCIALVNA